MRPIVEPLFTAIPFAGDMSLPCRAEEGCVRSRFPVTICYLGANRFRVSRRTHQTMPFAAPRHLPVGVQPWSERKAQYVATRVSPSRVYGRRWQKLRAAYLAQHPICECGCGHVATVVHHKQPHHGDTALLLDWENLQALTKPCHDRITAQSGGGFGNRRRSE